MSLTAMWIHGNSVIVETPREVLTLRDYVYAGRRLGNNETRGRAA